MGGSKLKPQNITDSAYRMMQSVVKVTLEMRIRNYHGHNHDPHKIVSGL
jgi:hypothetical protein